jgi:hypothetical protein
MDLGLSGQTLLAENVDYSAVLNFSDKYMTRIESPFALHLPNGDFEFSPESDPAEAFEPLRELVGQTVTESAAEDSGALRLAFANGATVPVEADESYEAWTVAGPGGMLVVCMPRGELAIWDKKQRD